jgi:hypothetical protein
MINPSYLRFWGAYHHDSPSVDDLTARRWFSQCAGRDGATAILSLSSAGNTSNCDDADGTNEGFP